ncbi:hypothetical protein C7391_0196 [Methanimicrococcus blatticola]|uniref:Uncharacterized protein n=1 Tax=Methanimicrococcus blatticola TaxID=91560 RepID=A0A484F8W8_9EURY|nr:hypothetical protein C7391_0196 [Methanimicrococcus blatticola]
MPPLCCACLYCCSCLLCCVCFCCCAGLLCCVCFCCCAGLLCCVCFCCCVHPLFLITSVRFANVGTVTLPVCLPPLPCCFCLPPLPYRFCSLLSCRHRCHSQHHAAGRNNHRILVNSKKRISALCFLKKNVNFWKYVENGVIFELLILFIILFFFYADV